MDGEVIGDESEAKREEGALIPYCGTNRLTSPSNRMQMNADGALARRTLPSLNPVFPLPCTRSTIELLPPFLLAHCSGFNVKRPLRAIRMNSDRINIKRTSCSWRLPCTFEANTHECASLAHASCFFEEVQQNRQQQLSPLHPRPL